MQFQPITVGSWLAIVAFLMTLFALVTGHYALPILEADAILLAVARLVA